MWIFSLVIPSKFWCFASYCTFLSSNFDPIHNHHNRLVPHLPHHSTTVLLCYNYIFILSFQREISSEHFGLLLHEIFNFYVNLSLASSKVDPTHNHHHHLIYNNFSSQLFWCFSVFYWTRAKMINLLCCCMIFLIFFISLHSHMFQSQSYPQTLSQIDFMLIPNLAMVSPFHYCNIIIINQVETEVSILVCCCI